MLETEAHRAVRGNQSSKKSGSGSLEQDGLVSIVAMKKKEQAGLVHYYRLGNHNVMRTKRARRWRSVFFQRSTWAVSPVSFPTAVCCSSGMTARYAAQKSVKQYP
jgi:hypothetical protein